MAIRYRPDGSFEFDTIEEALAWHKRVTGKEEKIGAPTNGSMPPALNKPVTRPFTAPQGTGSPETFLDSLKPNGRAVIEALANAFPSAMTTHDLADRSGVQRSQLGPVFRHIGIAARKSGFAAESVFTREEHADPTGKTRSVYHLSEQFAKAAKMDRE
jgi:hypothetical protein